MASDMGGFTINRPSIVTMRLATEYSSNISAGDHVKFDTIDFDEGNGIIVPDVTSAYTTGAGMSRGRVMLAPGRIYDIEFNSVADVFSSTTGQISYVIYDVVSGLELGPRSYALTVTSTTNNGPGGGYLRQIYAPTSQAIIEVRLTSSTSVSRIGTTGTFMPMLIIRAL